MLFHLVTGPIQLISTSHTSLGLQELGYLGFQVSDWGAAQNAFTSTNVGGTDINMPGGGIPVPGLDPWGNGVLEQGVLNGTVTEARLDEQVVRALTPYFALGQDEADFPTANLSRIVLAPNASVVAYQVAMEGITLVKNVGGGRGLPLVSPRSLGRESMTSRNLSLYHLAHFPTVSIP